MSAPVIADPVVEVLQAALAHLRENGWRQRSFGDYGKPCCTVGAFIYSSNKHRFTYQGYVDRAVSFVSRAVGGPSQIVEPFLYHWNDVPGRTFAEVEAAFERAIALAEAGVR